MHQTGVSQLRHTDECVREAFALFTLTHTLVSCDPQPCAPKTHSEQVASAVRSADDFYAKLAANSNARVSDGEAVELLIFCNAPSKASPARRYHLAYSVHSSPLSRDAMQPAIYRLHDT